MEVASWVINQRRVLWYIMKGVALLAVRATPVCFFATPLWNLRVRCRALKKKNTFHLCELRAEYNRVLIVFEQSIVQFGKVRNIDDSIFMFHRPTVFMIVAMYYMRHNVLYVEMNNNLKSKIKPQIRASVHSLLICIYIFHENGKHYSPCRQRSAHARLFIRFSFKAIYIFLVYFLLHKVYFM